MCACTSDRGCRKTWRVGNNIIIKTMADEDDDYKDPSAEEVIDWMITDPDAREEFLEGDEGNY